MNDADPDLDERKERVLHTRVPESLERQLKRRARGLGMSVSTIVRHTLLNTFGLVEDIVTDGTNIALSIAGQEPIARVVAPASPAGDGADILGWQDVTLNRNAVCEHCNAVLRKGRPAALGVREQPGPPTIICRKCLPRVTDDGTPGGSSKGRR